MEDGNLSCVVGLQYGDEGKGRITDLINTLKDVDYVVRFNGSKNAGHSFKINGNKYVTHQVPAGVLTDKASVIANGCYVEPVALAREMKGFRDQGFNIENIRVSELAHVVMLEHIYEDIANETDKKRKNTIGTTRSGVGPCAVAKFGRTGLKLGNLIKLKNYLSNQDLKESLEFLAPFVCDTTLLLIDAVKENKKILFEGAQSFQLDVDYGDYPFVTSSSCIAQYSLVSSGIPLKYANNMRVYGVFKPYITRVGAGSFQTEMEESITKLVRQIGNEYGATTGRKRKCGWLDLPALKRACMVNGVTDLCLVKSDIFLGFTKILVCTGYDRESNPIFIELKGWDKLSISSATCKTNKEFMDFIELVETTVGVPVKIISYGAERKDYFTI